MRRRQAALADQFYIGRQTRLFQLNRQIGRRRPEREQHDAVRLGRDDTGGNRRKIRIGLFDAAAVDKLQTTLLGVFHEHALKINVSLVVREPDRGAGLGLGHVHRVVTQLRHRNNRRLRRNEAPRPGGKQGHGIGHRLHADLGIVGDAS